eukprot:CAMPEP_0176091406 /NCGR_PEP_ID=MMETSP0120_2-20121206/45783_1 /TAXON_ID=160619 /ORGANISM="Kryptoperidinium foliaceum, Strain CCMP 1326" /LENGTH=557 /DNA_ID=CAMNT_0017425299 /DNA_START=23 /DNA_END=1696 /DNA_ORIENTATION=+
MVAAWRMVSRVGILVLGSCLARVAAQTLKLSSTLTIEKTDSKTNTYEQVASLLEHAREKKLDANVIRFLDNTVQQLSKVLDAAKVVEEKRGTEVPKDFTPQKYRVKPMPKLQAKKITVKKITAKELRARLQQGKDIHFDEPLLVTNATALFNSEDWDNVRRHWSASRIMGDAELEKELKIEYWPPDKARARLVGNMLQMEEPELVSFSRYVVVCFHGTPAKPKLPGQNTEHCEQTVDAQSMVRNASELKELSIFPEISNALPMQGEFRTRMLKAAAEELPSIIGKNLKKWEKSRGHLSYQYFVFGPSGSGDKLHAENGLPFYDILIHGSRRWLLLTEEEMQRVAEKAREALEFDKTSAYMFFEEKLPELKEEFGLKKYMEANQQAGDLVIVPSGWFRVSLSLADSISYYETILSKQSTLRSITDNNVWRPQIRQYQLAYCYDPKDLHLLPGVEKGSDLYNWLKDAIAKVKLDELLPGILSVLLQCGSTLVLDKEMPQLKVEGLTVCTKAVWKQCRSQLKTKLKEKGSTASLAWLPEEPPKSLSDLRSSEAQRVVDEL